MASTVTSIKATANAKRLIFDFDPNVTSAVETPATREDMRDFGYVLAWFFRTIGVSALGEFRIMANAAATGGTSVEVKAHALGSQPDAVGDYIFLEAIASEIVNLGTNLRYVTTSTSFGTATDEGVIGIELGQPRFAKQNLTQDTIA